MTNSDDRVAVGNLRIDPSLYELVGDRIAPGTGLDADDVWASFDGIVADLAPKNRALLEARDALQEQLDAWHREHAGAAFDEAEYLAFLLEIGYLVAEGDDFEITTGVVDPEISSIAGPQLVVPVDNARYALNATNARWGSLYDALYGTDVISEDGGAQIDAEYNPVRGERVVAQAERFLDGAVPLGERSYADVVAFTLGGADRADGGRTLICAFADGAETGLADPAAFVGYRLDDERLAAVLLRHNGLHIEIQIDPEHAVGAAHRIQTWIG